MGAVYVFDVYSSGLYIQRTRVQAPFSTRDARFGSAVAVSSDGAIMVVGAPGYSSPRVQIFQASANTYTMTSELLGRATANEFGSTIALSSQGWLVVGDPTDSANGTDAGAAFVYEPSDSSVYSLASALLPAGLGANHRFGHAVAIQGPRVVVGAPHYQGQRGRVHVFEKQGAVFVELAVVHPLASADKMRFGWSVDISFSNTIVVGAYHGATPAGNSGAVYMFQANVTTGVYEQVRLLESPEPAQLGHRVAISEYNDIGVAAYWEDADAENLGAVVVL